MSHVVSYHHIVLVTKDRGMTIEHDYCQDLYDYIAGLAFNKNSILFEVNGIEDHIHLLVRIHSTIALADFVKNIKVSTSIWLKANPNFPNFIGWCPKYAAFTKSERDFEMIRNYIKKQKVHHGRIGLLDECKKIFKEEKVEYDEKYLFM